MTVSPINMDELNEIMNSDQELIKECFDDFLTDYPDIIIEIRTAIDTENFENLDNSAHKLKGIFKYLAADQAAQAALELEKAGRNQDPDNLLEKLSVLDTQCKEVAEYIQTIST